jgi:exonuclease III
MRFSTWNITSHYRSVSLTASARDLETYKLDLLDVQEFRWDRGGTVRAEDYKFFLKKKKRKSSIGNRIFCTPQNSIGS